jgi:hypothetical protein
MGQVFTAEGEMIKVGKIVMDTRHADINLGYASAALHYDDTGDEVAVVRAGEDHYGIWVAGAVVPEATPAKVAKLRRSPLSGDWRRVDGNLELTAALAVNVPAFPVYAMEGEDQTALVAAGSVYPEMTEEIPEPPPTGIDIHALVAAVRAEVDMELEQEDRAWKLRELIDDDDTDDQGRRIDRLAEIFAADANDAPVAPAPAPAPATAAPADPNAPAPAGDEYDENAMTARQRNAQFSIIPEADNPPPPDFGGQQPAPAGQQAAPAPAPAAAPAAPAPAAPVTPPAG